MEKRISDCLSGRSPEKYILPFFWQHGEDHETLREEISAIETCGIDQLCVESRVHEDFGRDKWWEDFGFILDECKKRNMRVWLLDDKRFPTGYANNYIESHQELRAVHLRMEIRDFAGPAKDRAILPVPLDEDERLISAVAYRRGGESGETLTGEGVQLLPLLRDGLIWWDIPEGFWCVCYLIRTRRFDKKRCEPKKNYIDPLNAESCRAMLHAVYEPHYEHFKEYFGNTFAGFFSDEPGFSNDDKHYFSILGNEGMLLPWNDDMPAIMAKALNRSQEKVLKLLPALWYPVNEETAEVRVKFMDIVTDQFEANLTGMLGDWCRGHGVEYIGHMIEDDNAHQRLGCGCGHFFKAIQPMDMSGCDIVLHQIIPGYLSMPHTQSGYGVRGNTEFFLYTLMKLTSSLAHIDPKKKGRAMCEIFGAFGWAEGVPEMKYLADCMLAGGINHFVPHAFSPKYPDPDCPPHFYKRGHSIQFGCFARLMSYMQKMAYILSDGVHRADVAVYYNAEAEWSGMENMLQQDVCASLTRSQIDYDILPQRTLREATEEKHGHGRLSVNGESYGAVVVPYSRYLPEPVIDALNSFHEQGLPVVYVNGLPENSAAAGEVSSLETLPELLRSKGVCGFSADKQCPTLRYFHTVRDNEDVCMLWNEDPENGINVNVRMTLCGKTGRSGAADQPGTANQSDRACQPGRPVLYDVWNSRAFEAQQTENGVRIKLAPSQALILSFGSENLPMFDYADEELPVFSGNWRISKADVDGNGDRDGDMGGNVKVAGNEIRTGKVDIEYLGFELKNYAPEMPSFSGKLIYETTFDRGTRLELGTVGEIAQVWVNGNYAGTVLTKNERMDISRFVNSDERNNYESDNCEANSNTCETNDRKAKTGKNELRIEVIVNQGYEGRDRLSTFLALPPMGLLGPVRLG